MSTPTPWETTIQPDALEYFNDPTTYKNQFVAAMLTELKQWREQSKDTHETRSDAA